MNRRELEEELKRTDAGRKFLKEAEPCGDAVSRASLLKKFENRFNEPDEDVEYEKDLNELKEQILQDGNTLLTKRDLLERFCEIDKEYKGRPWNLLQILANINILVGEEPSEKTLSVQDCINAIENTDCELSPQAWEEITTSIVSLPPAMPTRKKGKWIFSKTIFDKHGFTAECYSCHKKWKTYDEIRWRKENKFCPNCGEPKESEE